MGMGRRTYRPIPIGTTALAPAMPRQSIFYNYLFLRKIQQVRWPELLVNHLAWGLSPNRAGAELGLSPN
jgi:hypothetical protein